MKRFKKYIPLLLIIPLLLSFIPFDSASAYEGGLLNGKALKRVSDDSIANELTDNNTSTFIGLNDSSTKYYYEFSSPVTIDSYRVDLTISNSAQTVIELYDSSNVLITSYTVLDTQDNLLVEVTPVSGVEKVVFRSNASTLSNTYEVDLFGTFSAIDFSGGR